MMCKHILLPGKVKINFSSYMSPKYVVKGFVMLTWFINELNIGNTMFVTCLHILVYNSMFCSVLCVCDIILLTEHPLRRSSCTASEYLLLVHVQWNLS